MTSEHFQDVILGDIIKDQKLFHVAQTCGVNSEYFTGERSKIWDAIKAINEENLVLDLTSVSARCAKSIDLLMRIFSNSAPGLNFRWYCNQLITITKIKKSALKIEQLNKKILSLSFSENPEPILQESSKILSDMKNCVDIDEQGTRFTNELLDSTIARIEKRIIEKRDGVTRGISTGITKLDSQTAGLVSGRFYIIAARTSVGKTTFASFIALNAAIQNKNVLIFSNEMDAEDLVEKFISQTAFVDSKLIQSGELSEFQMDKIISSVHKIAKANFGVNQHYGWDLETLEAEIYRCHALGKCDLVFVDYAQQVKVKGARTKLDQVSEVATKLKKISRDLNIAVVGLAQINRETEKTGKPVLPGLANLKDSGALEQDADVVMILHKDDLADSDVVLRIAKNRHGETGLISLRHHAATNSYTEVNQ